MPSNLPLPALLSQTLVAFTIELDNEFERLMAESGYAGASLSLVVWLNVMRFIGGELPVRDLAARASLKRPTMNSMIGCLERWRFVVVGPHVDGKRDGWGSGRGIRPDWRVRLTPMGSQACHVWPPLLGAIEDRWRARFGSARILTLHEGLTSIAERLDVELPQGLPGGWFLSDTDEFPERTLPARADLPIAALLSQALFAFSREFDAESTAPMAISANVLRVLTEQPVRVEELPRLTGVPPEMVARFVKARSPYFLVEPDPAARRGQIVRLSETGLKAQEEYYAVVEAIEQRWRTAFGSAVISKLRESLQDLFEQRDGDRLRIAEGLIAPPGVRRAGGEEAALGRRKIAAAARQRNRDLVAQTCAFISDPAGALPHYPLWDANRGFGP